MTELREAVARAMYDADFRRDFTPEQHEAMPDTSGAWESVATMPISGPGHVAKWMNLAGDALTALSQSGPTEAMVEAGARAALHEAGADPDVFVGINGQAAYETVKGQVRACLTAAFKELGEK